MKDRKDHLRKGLLDLNYGGRGANYLIAMTFGGGILGALVLSVVRAVGNTDPLKHLGPGFAYGMAIGFTVYLLALTWAAVISRDPKELRVRRVPRLRIPRKGKRRR